MRFYFFLFICCLISTQTYAQNNHIHSTDLFSDLFPGILLTPEDRITTDFKKVTTQTLLPSDAYKEKRPALNTLLTRYDNGDVKGLAPLLAPYAHGGARDAQESLGLLYRLGQGVDQSDTKAFQWLNRAALQGAAVAQHHIGSMYYTGSGVKKDAVEAAYFLSLAARNHPTGPAKTQAKNDLESVLLRLSIEDKNALAERMTATP